MSEKSAPLTPRDQTLKDLKRSGFKTKDLADSSKTEFTYTTGRGKGKETHTVSRDEVKAMLRDQVIEDMIAKRFEGIKTRTPSELKELCKQIKDEVANIKTALTEGNRELLQRVLGDEKLQEQVETLKAKYYEKAEAKVESKIKVSQDASERGPLNYALRQRYQTEIGKIETQYGEQLINIQDYTGTPKERLQKVLASNILPATEVSDLRKALSAGLDQYPGNRFVDKYNENLRNAWGAEETEEVEEFKPPEFKVADPETVKARYDAITKIVTELPSDPEDVNSVADEILKEELARIYGEGRDKLADPETALVRFIQGGSNAKVLDSMATDAKNRLKIECAYRFKDRFEPRVNEINRKPAELKSQLDEAERIERELKRHFTRHWSGKLPDSLFKDTETALADPTLRNGIQEKVKARLDKLQKIQDKLKDPKSYDTVDRSIRNPGGRKILNPHIVTSLDDEVLDDPLSRWLGETVVNVDTQSPIYEKPAFIRSGTPSGLERVKQDIKQFSDAHSLGLEEGELDSPVHLTVKFGLGNDLTPVLGEDTQVRLQKALDEAQSIQTTVSNDELWKNRAERLQKLLLDGGELKTAYDQALSGHPGGKLAKAVQETKDRLGSDYRKAETDASTERDRLMNSIGTYASVSEIIQELNRTPPTINYLDNAINNQFKTAIGRFEEELKRQPLETGLAAIGFPDLADGDQARVFYNNLQYLSIHIRDKTPSLKYESSIKGPLELITGVLKSTDQSFANRRPDSGRFLIVDIGRVYNVGIMETRMTAQFARVENGKVVKLTDDQGNPLDRPQPMTDEEMQGSRLYLPI